MGGGGRACRTFHCVGLYSGSLRFNSFYFILFGATTTSWPWPPHSRNFYVTPNDAPQSVGLLWTTDQPVTETST